MKIRLLTEGEKFSVGAVIVFLGFCAFFGYAKSARAAEPTEYAQSCPGGTEGCYDPVRHAIYYPRIEDREHELDHAVGMRHGPWARQGGNWPWMCARVTVSGPTHWRVGETICRTPRGEYVSAGI